MHIVKKKIIQACPGVSYGWKNKNEYIKTEEFVLRHFAE